MCVPRATQEYAWIWLDGAGQLPLSISADDAQLLAGTLAFEWVPPPHAPFDAYWTSAMTTADCASGDMPYDAVLPFAPDPVIFESAPPTLAYLVYDSVVAMALALHAPHSPSAHA